MTEPDTSIAHLRATAHPLRLRMLSLLTAEAMSAAEVARALDVTHANASYHLRLLHDAGELVVEGEEKIRGGTAKRYRYDATREVRRSGGTTPQDRVADARATAAEIERRALQGAPGRSYYSDLESWVPAPAWNRALELVEEASVLLHASASPAGTPGTVHVSATTIAFTLTGGLTGDATRLPPAEERR